jgi:hypothetical protein
VLSWRKKILKNNKKTKTYLDSLPKLYAIFHWAGYGILELPWSGKYNLSKIPLVYVYYDRNGECDEYRLMPITFASSGGLHSWHSDEEYTKALCKILNEDELL